MKFAAKVLLSIVTLLGAHNVTHGAQAQSSTSLATGQAAAQAECKAFAAVTTDTTQEKKTDAHTLAALLSMMSPEEQAEHKRQLEAYSLIQARKLVTAKRGEKLYNEMYTTLESLPPELIHLILSYEGHPRNPYILQGKLEQVLKLNLEDKISITAAAVAHNSIIVGLSNGVIEIFSPEDQKRWTSTQKVQAHNDPVTAITELPFQSFASGSGFTSRLDKSDDLGTLTIWKHCPEKQQYDLQKQFTNIDIKKLAALPNGTIVIAGATIGEERATWSVWDPRSATCLYQEQNPYSNYLDEVLVLSSERIMLVNRADGDLVLLQKNNDTPTAHRWEIESRIHFNQDPLESLCHLPDGTIGAIAKIDSDYFQALSLKLPTGEQTCFASGNHGTNQERASLVVLQDGRLGFFEQETGITILDPQSRTQTIKLKESGNSGWLMLLPDGRLVEADDRNGLIKIWR